MLALSCTQFVAQLLPLPAEGTRREAQALLKIAAGPAQWLPAETCLGLDALLPFPRACPSLVATSWSSAMRTSIVTMPRWQTYVDELAAASQRDDALFVHPFAHWMQLSTAKILATAYARAESLGAVRRREIVDMELSRLAASGSRKFQPRLLFLEQSSHPSFDALRFLERRWSRWFAGAELASCLARSRIIAERLSGYVASCVLHAILISWLNGWCMARRFQEACPPHSCRLSSTCPGRDCIEHYAVCEAAWSAAPWALLADRPRSLANFLLVGPILPFAQDDLIRLAYFVFATYGSYNLARARGIRLDPNFLAHSMRERWMFARSRSRKGDLD